MRLKVLESPGVEEASEALEEALAHRLFILLAGSNRIDYQGRSASKLGWGERVVLIKPDGTLLVHRPGGRDPVNWQPPGALLSVRPLEGQLLLRAARRTPRETLEIFFDRVDLLATLQLQDKAPFDMLLTEEELYRVLRANPELIEEGLRLAREQKEVAGRYVDFTGYDREGRYVVMEVKKDPADRAAVQQLYKYVVSLGGGDPSKVRGILVAPQLKPTARRLLKSLNLEFKPINLELCARRLQEGLGRAWTRRLDEHLDEED